MDFDIIKTPTYFEVEGDEDGYCLGMSASFKAFKDLLDINVYDSLGRYIETIRYYRWREGKYHFPIHTYNRFINHMRTHFSEINLVTHLYTPIIGATSSVTRKYAFKMKEGWHDRPEHGPVFEHLVYSEGSILGNDLQTGKGKSYVGVKMSVLEDTPVFVACYGLVDQWVDNFLEKTTVDAEGIFQIKGHSSVAALWDIIESKDSSLYPVVIVGSINTIKRYADYVELAYREYPPIEHLCARLGIGLAIYDEIHLNTHAINSIMMTTPIQKNIILSATPERARPREQQVFSLIFPKGIIGGSNRYDRYVDARIEGYEVYLNCNQACFQAKGYGYSHIKYESQLLRRSTCLQSFVNRVLMAVQAYFINRYEEGDKCLIFFATVAMVDLITEKLRIYLHSSVSVVSYTAKDPIENLRDGTIIVSTPKSCGVGKDIHNLITVINTVSVNSKPMYQQMFGRLRKIPGKHLFFLDLLNTTVQGHMAHFWNKRKVLKACARTLEIINVDTRPKPRDDFESIEVTPETYYRRREWT